MDEQDLAVLPSGDQRIFSGTLRKKGGTRNSHLPVCQSEISGYELSDCARILFSLQEARLALTQ